MKTFAIAALCLLALAILAVQTGFVNAHYARRVNNQPLSSPVTIERIDGSRIQLRDGRSIELFDGPLSDRWSSLLKAGDEIEVDDADGDEDFPIYAKESIFVCGGTSPFRIPLIPHNVNRYRRSFVDIGSFVPARREAQNKSREASVDNFPN